MTKKPKKKPKLKKLATQSSPALSPLTVGELQLLRNADYEEPVRARRHEIAIAERLIERGLLERDPSSSVLFVRCTERGLRERVALTSTSVKRVVTEIKRLSDDARIDDSEAAASLEYALWHRVLVELVVHACAAVPFSENVVHVALTTTALKFRRGY